MTPPLNVSRRRFLQVSGTAVGGLLVAIYIPDHGVFADENGPFVPNAFIQIDVDDIVTIWAKNPEIGQGVSTSLPMIVAEELDVEWSRVRSAQADFNPQAYGGQGAGGSWSVHSSWEQLRKAGATARAMLIMAAAREWGVPDAECSTDLGFVIHARSGRRRSYGQLAAQAARLDIPDDVVLKAPEDFRLLGQSIGVVDAREIATGRTIYGMDVRLPGMLFASIARPPFGAHVKSFDATRARQIKGVRHIVQIEGLANPIYMLPGVAVVADTPRAAMEGADALEVEWTPGPHGLESTEGLRTQFEELLSQPGTVLRDDGDVDRAFKSAHKTVEAEYEVPFLAHAQMAPVSCTADVRSDRCEIRAPMQMPAAVHGVAAYVAGVPPEAVTVRMTRAGGGFGRRLLSDYVADAAHLSKVTGTPVQLVCSRENDFQHDYFRAAGRYRMRAALDAENQLQAWSAYAVTTSREQYARSPEPASTTEVFPDEFPAGMVPNFRLQYSPAASSIPVGPWRGPGHNATAFVGECFMDEVATMAGVDPVDLRVKLLGAPRDVPYGDHGGPTYNTGRLANVLRLAAEKAGWGESLPEGHGRGIAAHFIFGSYVAHVADVVVESSRLTVKRLVVAVDCGIVVNRSGALAQIEGATLDGLGTALRGEVTIQNGRPQQVNFDGYRLLRINEVPELDIHIVPSTETPFGLGEIALQTVAPAVCNAIFNATGQRIRRLPILSNGLRMG